MNISVFNVTTFGHQSYFVVAKTFQDAVDLTTAKLEQLKLGHSGERRVKSVELLKSFNEDSQGNQIITSEQNRLILQEDLFKK